MARRQGTITQRYQGSWQIRYSLVGSDNKRKQVSETIKGLKKDAEKLLRKRLSEIDSNRYVDKSKATVSQLMYRWMSEHVADNCTERTAQGYLGYIMRYIDPTIGSVPYQELTPRQIKIVYDDMRVKGLSSNTVIQLHRILRKALNHAVTEEPPSLSRNPADSKTAQPPKKRQYTMEMWDVPTINQFLQLSRNTRFGDLYSFAVRTGLRRSEICGLKWESVDLPSMDGESGNLSVVTVLHRIKGKGLKLAEPKTKGSRRSITLSPDTIDVLRKVKGTQQLQHVEYGDLRTDSGFVFTGPDGSPIVPDHITQDFASLIKKYNLPHLTFHGLRHAFATLALKAGINTKVVSEALGHSKVGITMDLYQHVLPNMQNDLADAVSGILRREF